jgi:hypothetical protein
MSYELLFNDNMLSEFVGSGKSSPDKSHYQGIIIN